jgi:hypothetical protein
MTPASRLLLLVATILATVALVVYLTAQPHSADYGIIQRPAEAPTGTWPTLYPPPRQPGGYLDEFTGQPRSTPSR